MLNIFACTYWPFAYFEKCLFKSFDHFWIGFFLLLNFLDTFWMLILYQINALKIHSSILSVAFLLHWYCLGYTNFLNCCEANLSFFFFFFFFLCLWYHIQKIIDTFNVINLFPYFFFLCVLIIVLHLTFRCLIHI